MSSYEKIQFIGHSINTGPQLVRDGFRERTVYTGDKDPVVDLGKRAAFFRDVLKNAEKSPLIIQDRKVLKLLMLPEFFFRGQEQAYEMRHIDNLMASLQASVTDSRREDWIFVFGTVIGAGQAEGDNGTDGYQYCLIQQGGRTKNIKENRVRMVMRDHIAENEFIMATPEKNGQERWERRYHRLPPEYSGIGMEEQQNHYDGRSIFELAGITFGVEIGPDHCEGRLRHSPQPPGHRKVQIQLIPSCGTEILPDSVTAVKDGWVFQCDGLNECYTDLRKVIAEHQRLPEQSAKIALFPQLPPAVIHTSCNTEDLFVGGPGKLHFYEPVTIPEAVTSGQKDSGPLREKIAA